MKFLELFDSRDKKRRLSHIKNLVALACADGSLDNREMDLIFKIGVRAGLSPGEIERIFDRPESVPFYPPESYRERIEQLYDMVMVMMVDGELHDKEISFCKFTALKLGFSHKIIDSMINHIIETINNGIASEIALRKLLNLVK